MSIMPTRIDYSLLLYLPELKTFKIIPSTEQLMYEDFIPNLGNFFRLYGIKYVIK